jgi:hypothetical protein
MITDVKRVQHYATLATALFLPITVIMLILARDVTGTVRVGALLIATVILLHMLTRPDVPTRRPTVDDVRRALTGRFPELQGDPYADQLAATAHTAMQQPPDLGLYHDPARPGPHAAEDLMSTVRLPATRPGDRR